MLEKWRESKGRACPPLGLGWPSQDQGCGPYIPAGTNEVSSHTLDIRSFRYWFTKRGTTTNHPRLAPSKHGFVDPCQASASPDF